jgi:hypothetical protein
MQVSDSVDMPVEAIGETYRLRLYVAGQKP